MFADFFFTLAGDFVIGGVALIVGVLFSTPIKDAIKGVPADLRAELTKVEADALATVKSAKTSIAKTAVAGALEKATAAKAPAAAPILVPAPAPAPAAAAAIGAGAPSGPAVTG